MCASTGNTAASAAAYAARAGHARRSCSRPPGAIAAAEARRRRALSAHACSRCAGTLRRRAPQSASSWSSAATFALVNSLNPHRIEGQKTAAFEVIEQLGRATRRARAPLRRRRQHLRVREGFRRGGRTPRLVAGAGERARDHDRLRDPHRRAGACRRGRQSSSPTGRVELVSVADEEITDAWLEIASREGVFCEPSSAAGFAALAHVDLEPGTTVVCVLTGHGLKDTAAVDVLDEPRRSSSSRPSRRSSREVSP